MGPAEDPFLQALMGSPIATCVVDHAGRFQLVNPALCAFTGRSRQTLLAMRWQDIVDPDALRADAALLDALPRDADHVRVAKRYRTAAGELRFGDLAVSPIRDPDGTVRRFLAQIVDVTERVRTEERHRLLEEVSSDIVVRTDADGRAEWVSSSVESLLGWRPGDLVGRPVRDLLADEDHARVHEESEPLRHGHPIRFEARLRCADGSLRWVAVTARPVHDIDGRLVGRVDGWRDVEEQVRARAALTASEARFRLLAENASDVVYLSGPDGRIQWVSPSATTVLGMDPRDIVGSRAIEFVHPDDLAVATREQARVLAGESVIFDVRMRRSDERLRWYQALIQPVMDEVGAVVGRTGSIRDVTAEHEARVALEASERLHRTAMDALHDGVVVHDRGGRILAASPSALHILGGTVDEVLGRTVADLGWDLRDDEGRPLAPEAHPAVATLRDGVAVHERILQLVHEDGDRRWVRVNTEPLRDGTGALIGMVGSFADITAQRMRDAALQASQARFRAALETLDEGVVVLRAGGDPDDPIADLRIDWANRRAMDEWFVGWEQDAVEGRRLREVDPGLSDKLLGIYRMVLATGEPYRELLPFGDGPERRMLDARVVPFPGGLLHIASDVTEMHRLTEELRAGEQRFRVAFEALDVGVVVLRPVLDADGRLVDAEIVWANRSARDDWFRGRPASVLEGGRLFDVDPQGRGELTAIYRAVLETGRIHRGEAPWAVDPGRPPIWVEHRIVPFEGGILHLGTDVTEAHLARAALEEAHQIARLGVWRRDLRTGEATWSDEMYRIFERDPELGPLDMAAASAMGREEVERMRSQAETRAREAGPDEEWEAERELVRDDGRPLWILTRTRAERDASGSIVAYRGTTQDITERRLAQQMRERFSQELEQRVTDRTADLATANEELRSFSYSLSHDLRAPLRSIAGFAGMLQRHNRVQLDEEGQRRLSNILSASQTMGAVIDDLLLYLRLGNGAVQRKPIALDAVVEALGVAHSALMAATGGRLVLEQPAAVPLADPTLLGEILGNLVENALHYRRPGVPPEVRIAAVQDGGWVTLSVADNGIGIDPAAHDRIFEAFVRLVGDEAHRGTGIGLAVVRRAARAMETDVTVESVVGEGSIFRVVLPAAPTAG